MSSSHVQLCHEATPSYQVPVWSLLGSWLVQGAGGEDVVDSLRLPSAVRQASLLPGQPETTEPAVKAIEEESERYFLKNWP